MLNTAYHFDKYNAILVLFIRYILQNEIDSFMLVKQISDTIVFFFSS